MDNHLSRTELEIMELFWSSETELGFTEIMDYFATHKNRIWKKQTLSTFLRKLISEGFLERSYRGRSAYYTCILSKEQYKQRNIQRIFHEDYDGCLTDFMSALIGDNKITEEDKESLIETIKRR